MNKEEILFFILVGTSVVFLAHLLFLKENKSKEKNQNKNDIRSPLMSRYFIGESEILGRNFSRVKSPKPKKQKSTFLQRFSKGVIISTPHNTPEFFPVRIIPKIETHCYPEKSTEYKEEIETFTLPPSTEQAHECIHCISIERINGFSMFNVKQNFEKSVPEFDSSLELNNC